MTTEPFHVCSCKKTYLTRDEWDQLPNRKTFTDDEGALLESRDCTAIVQQTFPFQCCTNRTVCLIPAPTYGDFMSANYMFIQCKPGFLQRHSLLELMRFWYLWEQPAHFSSLPDQWTSSQISHALLEGRAPVFASTKNGRSLHAVGVPDCPCRDCKEAIYDAEGRVGE